MRANGGMLQPLAAPESDTTICSRAVLTGGEQSATQRSYADPLPASAFHLMNALPFCGSEEFWSETTRGAVARETEIERGALDSWLSADFFHPGETIHQWKLEFFAADSDAPAEIIFAVYPGVRARLRIPTSALLMNSWLLSREGALLKPMCGGRVVPPDEVVRIRQTLVAGPDGPVAWWQEPWKISPEEPPLLDNAESMHQFLLDEFGQCAWKSWPGKTRTREEMVAGLQAAASREAEPWAGRSRWGGDASKNFGGTGFFRTHHDGRRWWLVDPDGAAFWSTGLCCMAPGIDAAVDGLRHLLEWVPPQDGSWPDVWRERQSGVNRGWTLDYSVANLIRAFGAGEWRESWRRLALNFLRETGFNTIGNWSDWELGAAAQFPYTRPLPSISQFRTPKIFRDFPDVFDEQFPAECDEWARHLEVTRDDPAFIGYFLCNEPEWAFARQTPAEGMLVNTSGGPSRERFAAFLRERHGNESDLAAAWGCPVTFDSVASGRWHSLPVAPGFFKDAEDFSGILATRLFGELSAACRRVDPNHLNLGARFAHLPPAWMMPGLTTFDVFSFNSYSKKPRDVAAEISRALHQPILIGEWHFGSVDRGHPAAALETVAGQTDRAQAYRRYLEAHAAAEWCVGTHWFTLYDQSALGRFDGEPYNCGFLDICHRPHPEISAAATASHRILYEIAAGTRSAEEYPVPKHIARLSL